MATAARPAALSRFLCPSRTEGSLALAGPCCACNAPGQRRRFRSSDRPAGLGGPFLGATADLGPSWLDQGASRTVGRGTGWMFGAAGCTSQAV
eukprot:7080145-Pyramimonas_sp.AAC.1